MSETRTATTIDRLVFHRARLWRLAGAVAISSVILVGSTTHGGEQMPDFSLMDVNPTSASFGEMVSPHAYEGKVSGWYFGHAT